MSGTGLRRRRWLAGVLAALLALAVNIPPGVSAAGVESTASHGQGVRASCSPSRPSTYLVSTQPGVLPEGIGVARNGRTMYVTSSGTGAIYRGDVRRRTMEMFVPAGDAGRTSAAGVHVDRHGRVFVAGSTALDVYSPSGRLLAHLPAPAGETGKPFLNDLVLTRTAVYVTDSVNAVVYRAAVNGSGVGSLRPWFDAGTLQPDYPAYYWYLNGIVADPAGKTLLVAAQGIGALIRVDVSSETGSFVDTGGTTLGADGLLLGSRRTLFAVLNYEPPSTGVGVYRLRLSSDWRTATRLRRLPGGGGLQDPTTVGMDDRHRLLVVNSQLERAPGQPPYTVAALDLRCG